MATCCPNCGHIQAATKTDPTPDGMLLWVISPFMQQSDL